MTIPAHIAETVVDPKAYADWTAPWPHLMQIGVPDLTSCHHYGLFFDKKRALL